jgi:hypothetical protein
MDNITPSNPDQPIQEINPAMSPQGSNQQPKSKLVRKAILIIVAVIVLGYLGFSLYVGSLSYPLTFLRGTIGGGDRGSDLTSLKSITIDQTSTQNQLSYTFSPDGTGIIYTDQIGEAGQPTQYDFYRIDFKSGNKEKIHSILFNEDYRGEQPYTHWIDNKKVVIGAHIYLGQCDASNPNGAVIYDFATKQKQSLICVTRGRTDIVGAYEAELSAFYTFVKSSNDYSVSRFNKETGYSEYSYLVTDNNKYYLFANYRPPWSVGEDPIIQKEKELYGFLEQKAKKELTNDRVVVEFPPHPRLEGQKIYSRDKKYYLMFKNDFSHCPPMLSECSSKQSLEVYNNADERIKNIFMGEYGMGSRYVEHTGYTDFWTNTNDIAVLAPDNTNQLKLYFVEVE